MPVSVPFFTPSVQVGAWQTRGSMGVGMFTPGAQTLLSQSLASTQVWPVEQGGQDPPPQSASVSVPFFTPSKQDCWHVLVVIPVITKQDPLMHCVAAVHGCPFAQGTQCVAPHVVQLLITQMFCEQVGVVPMHAPVSVPPHWTQVNELIASNSHTPVPTESEHVLPVSSLFVTTPPSTQELTRQLFAFRGTSVSSGTLLILPVASHLFFWQSP
jgi:hypothetical protein